MRISTTTNAISSTAAPASEATIGALPQPSGLPRMRPKISRNRAPEKHTVPAQSRRPAVGFEDSSTRASVSATATIPIGTLTKKIASQPIASVSTPPTSGPTATAAPVVAPQRPSAVPRSRPL